MSNNSSKEESENLNVDKLINSNNTSSNNLEESNEEENELSNKESLKEDENISEEKLLQNEIEEYDFGTLLKAKSKLEFNNKKTSKKFINKNQIKKNSILTKLEKINNKKEKQEPKEYSALLKPKIQFKNREQHKLNSNSLLHKKITRDPRFDDLSGNFNEEHFKKNYSFVEEMAKNYSKKLDKIKKNKSFKKKMTEQQYELYKKQNNYIKGWINKQKQNKAKTEIKKEINKENKERMSKGQKPIYLNKNKINKFIKNEKES